MKLQTLPRLDSKISFLYVDKCVVHQDEFSLTIINKEGRTRIPIATINCLLIGPGTSITHAAIKSISENGCMICWCAMGEGHFYSFGINSNRSSRRVLQQARLYTNEDDHLSVVKRMYNIRFPGFPMENMSLEQLRGLEGARVKEIYKTYANKYNVKWKKRDYKTDDIDYSDPINQALSYGNAFLYDIIHAAILFLGYSPEIGFIHTGKMRSFVFDIADIYKTKVTIPAAFHCVSKHLFTASDIRRECRSRIEAARILKTLAKDIAYCLKSEHDDDEEIIVTSLWDGEDVISGGINYCGDYYDSYSG